MPLNKLSVAESDMPWDEGLSYLMMILHLKKVKSLFSRSKKAFSVLKRSTMLQNILTIATLTNQPTIKFIFSIFLFHLNCIRNWSCTLIFLCPNVRKDMGGCLCVKMPFPINRFSIINLPTRFFREDYADEIDHTKPIMYV